MKFVTFGLFILLLLAACGMFFYLPPQNEVYVYLFITIVSFAFFFLLLTFTSFKHAVLGFVGAFSFFTINYLAGFQMLNTLLLLSVIIGIAFLLKKSNSHG